MQRALCSPLALIVLTVRTVFSLVQQVSPPVLNSDNAPSWAHLTERILDTPTGERMQREAKERAIGEGPPHTDALFRIFDAKNESDIRVTLYRDTAAWCPYCQKVWLLLEIKQIPYRVKKISLNAYNDKPSWFTRKVDGGKLPAIELDGELHVESVEIMKLLDFTFIDKGPQMFPTSGTPEGKLTDKLFHLEKELQRAWFSLVFYSVKDETLDKGKKELWNTLRKVNNAIGETAGPWFLGGEQPSSVDIQYITTVERLVASSLYWKGLVIRGKFEILDQWLEAFENLPSYIATKSDDYTHVMAMPSQNGPGYFVDEAKYISSMIHGRAWKLPLNNDWLLHNDKQEEARHEAAFQLAANAECITRFSCRGAGDEGRPSFHAELADPYAEPNEDFMPAVDLCLRHVANALLKGFSNDDRAAAQQDLAGKGGSGKLRPNWEEYENDDEVYYWNYETGDVTWTAPTQQLDTCLAYLRDRVGVPRDMRHDAAMQLRAHLNWAIDILQNS